MIQRWLTLVLDLTNTVLAVFVVVLAVRLRDTVSVGFTGVSLTRIISFTGMLKLTISFWTQLETSIGAITRVKQFESETQDENLPAESNEPPNEWPSQGCIEIKGISASYT
jgi:ATP-binding cassette subfamily C (CFTR/MRP) protein 1